MRITKNSYIILFSISNILILLHNRYIQYITLIHTTYLYLGLRSHPFLTNHFTAFSRKPYDSLTGQKHKADSKQEITHDRITYPSYIYCDGGSTFLSRLSDYLFVPTYPAILEDYAQHLYIHRCTSEQWNSHCEILSF